MQFSFLKKTSGEYIAIIDVGSDSVGISIVEMSDIPRIIKTYREDIPFKDQIDFSVFTEEMMRTLKNVCQKMSLSGAPTPKRISIVLSSPWYISEARRINFEDKHSFVFSEKMSEKILNQEISLIKKNHEKIYGEGRNGIVIINKDILQVKLNGYTVSDPIGKKARSVDMDMVITMISNNLYHLMRNTLNPIFHDIPQTFSSSMSSLYITTREKYHNIDSFIIIDIGGEVTDISVVLEDIPRNLASFPFGRQTFFRYLKKWLNKDIEETKSLFSMYQDGSLSNEEKDKMEKALSPIRKIWLEDLALSLRKIPEPRIIPSAVFFLVNREVHSWFLESFTEKNTPVSVLFKNESEVVGLMGPDFLGYCKVQDGVCDPLIMMEALAIRRGKSI